MRRCASILERRINIDRGRSNPRFIINQGSEASGTDSCPLVAINDPVSRVQPISGKPQIGIMALVIARHVL